MKKRLLILLLSIFLPFVASSFLDGDFRQANAEENNNRLILNSSTTSITVGNYYMYNASVRIISYEEISTLSIEAHCDPSVFEVTYANNVLSNSNVNIYDATMHDDGFTISYIFRNFTSSSNKELFKFYFRLRDTATPGNYFFDLVISEAYNSDFEQVEMTGVRHYIDVVPEPETPKQTRFYAATFPSNEVIVGDEITMYWYTFRNDYYYNPASGSLQLYFDTNYFEIVSITFGNFFDNSIYDYKIYETGHINVSFVKSEIIESNSHLFDVVLRAIAPTEGNGFETSMISSDLYDTNLDYLQLYRETYRLKVSPDPNAVVYPRMYSEYEIDSLNHQVLLNIYLEENSCLGAGDFILGFDKDLVNYVSYTKNFTPTFFTVNDKEQQLSQGQVKFSILSLTDLVEEIDVITFVFSYNESSVDQNIVFGLTGSGLTDSLTNPIQLDISGIGFTIPATDFIVRWSKTYLYMDDPTFEGEGTGRCLADGLYVTAKRELLKLDELSIDNFIDNVDNRYTDELARYLAWAAACGDTTPFEGDGIMSNKNKIFDYNDNIQIAIAVASIVMIGLIPFAFLFLYKKRKTN